ncbi:MAG: L-serine ammonia-lyase, iron-sulfur-dependent, subunit alpha [Synergistaceae bacterium]|nr:L-serine ammonia-lyase, iron-sulfur-dependent, subunit alpha [Synergistaceae bacterium]MBR1604166.1 L-serine ammonia-lyase, iron-sulfur-dependent, subunit alpha [Synergistaceae bacterium]
MLEYNSINKLISEAESAHKKISDIVLAEQALSMDLSCEELFNRMSANFDVMCEAVIKGSDKDLKSMSGLTGGEAFKMQSYIDLNNGGLAGSFVNKAIAAALSVAGYNAAMGKIVAAPTAGSCGILPGCLVTLYNEQRASRDEIIMALFTAGAFGMVIANNASIAGAEGGCQAECGSASAMAAAALVELMHGTPEQCGHAAAIAIANQLGLVCDPVAGLVEIPCIKRNASGVMIALSAADMALAGIDAKIPVDECIAAMKNVGDALPAALRETSAGGLAATPTGRKLREKVFG